MFFVEKEYGTYYNYQTIVNSSALKEHIKEFRLTKCINKTTLKFICRKLEQIYHKARFYRNVQMYAKEILNMFYTYLHKTILSNRLLWNKNDWTLVNNMMFSSLILELKSSIGQG